MFGTFEHISWGLAVTPAPESMVNTCVLAYATCATRTRPCALCSCGHNGVWCPVFPHKETLLVALARYSPPLQRASVHKPPRAHLVFPCFVLTTSCQVTATSNTLVPTCVKNEP